MKKSLVLLVILMTGVHVLVSAHTVSDTTLTKSKAHKWFKKKEWLNGVALTPHKSINELEFARQYQLNKVLWDKAFVIFFPGEAHRPNISPDGNKKVVKKIVIKVRAA